MNVQKSLFVGVATAALMGSHAVPAYATGKDATSGGGTQQAVPSQTSQDNEQSTAAQDQAAIPDEIVVTGIRASLESAQARKRTANTIVDSIVADDIGKLPDTNTTEALQRISGIQVSRDRGEGGSVAIRGLTQVLTTLDGREIFTAGGGRGYNLQDFPAELLAGVDVYKTPTADLIEGGIGGVIDLRTRKPLDMDGLVISGSLRGRYQDLVDKVSPLASLLVSDKWDTGVGEMGLLVSGSYQERAFRSDIEAVGAPSERTDLIAGRTIVTPNGDYEPLVDGTRRRIGLGATFQWKPTPELELYAQAGYQEFRSIQQQRGLNNPTNGLSVVPGSVETFDGTDDFMRGTFQNLVSSTFGVTRDTYDKNQQYSAGFDWDKGAARLTGDFTYQHSTNDLYYTEQDLQITVPEATLDLSGKTPTMSFDGVDLTDLSNYRLGYTTRSENHYTGNSYAGRLDGDFEIDSPFLSGFKTGVRIQKMDTAFTPIRFFQPAGATSAANYSSLFETMPFDDFFFSNPTFPHGYYTAVTSNLRNDFDSVRDALGVDAEPAVDPASVYDMSETTVAGYAEMLFKVDSGLRFDGNVGVRVIKTGLSIDGNQRSTVGGVTTITPQTYDNDYVSVLPSANVRFHLTDELQLRLAASQTLTRPNFSQLSPAFTLVPAQGQGSGGNPELEPLRADQLDASLEYYFSPTGSVYLAGFYRKVKGFIFTSSNRQTIDGIDYVISQPTNGDDGTIKGVEVGGQTFFDFLPAPFDGFGVQANYTFIDSSTPSAIADYTTPLPGLSKSSFNISGLYEKYGLSVRVAYNYRSKYLSALYGLPLAGGGSQNIPIYRRGYGWLDASINYDITPSITVTLEGSNLLRTREFTYFDQETRPNNISVDDRQIMAGIRFKL
ncbi:TonB-dependent receptor [Stakelama saccharophila]|uniref:TonB-dependent receptor n=1 Tax=Stakelama saccharophila TaxID=3075605 RepID=A0ABZ0BBM1_9SPHN|nr:TonB-dependent receptor [Stakelama sp. W311]WNO54071.1 TonB-dependent receptor [Stakelama sp. W311]